MRRAVPGRSVARRHLDQRDRGEHREHRDLDAQQDLLRQRGDLDASVADVGHYKDPQDTDEQHPAARRIAADAVCVEQQEAVLPRDLRETRHHDDVRGDDAPAAEPADVRTEHSGAPGERRPAVGLCAVELAVADGDQQHRDEREHHDQGCLQPDERDDETQRRREAVSRCDGSNTDNSCREQTQGA